MSVADDADDVVVVAPDIVLRTARVTDLDQIADLLAERGEPADADDLRLVIGDPDEGIGSVLVVVNGDRVVSTATLLREVVTIGGVDVPAGQVEMVATARDHEGMGLVRALMGEAHRRSAARGDLLQVMIGIPFFYRQFGYAYSMPIPNVWAVHRPSAADPSVTVRDATDVDIDAMAALQHTAQELVDVRMTHSAACWRWLVNRSGSVQVVAERDGIVVATGRRTPDDEGAVLGELAGDRAGIEALIAASARDGHAAVVERPVPTLAAILAAIGTPPALRDRSAEWYYARVEALAPLLDHLRPVLVQRFRAAGLRGRHDVLLSSWRGHVRFTIDEEAMSNVVPGGAEQAPVSKGGSGVPPDLLAPTLLGPFGAAGLEARHGDVLLGRQRDLMEVLFPPQVSDLLTFYLAV